MRVPYRKTFPSATVLTYVSSSYNLLRFQGRGLPSSPGAGRLVVVVSSSEVTLKGTPVIGSPVS